MKEAQKKEREEVDQGGDELSFRFVARILYGGPLC